MGMRSFCATQACDFAIGLGDNFYEDGVKDVNDTQFKTKFEDVYGPLGIKFYQTLGNHDYQGNIQAQVDYTTKSKYWVMPATYYNFQIQDVEFFAIDTEPFMQIGQIWWLWEKLAASKAKWKIVFGHKPIYTSGSHGHTFELWLWLLPLIKSYGVDFYLAGHAHLRQVDRSGVTTYVTSGAAADPSKKPAGPPRLFLRQTPGFAHLEIDGNKATLRMLDAAGKEDYLEAISK